MMKQDENGFVFPLTVVISSVLCFLMLVVVSQLTRSGHLQRLNWETVRTEYAAESGLVKWLAGAKGKSDRVNGRVMNMNGIQIQIRVSPEAKGNRWNIHATAYGRFGVNQSVSVLVDPQTWRTLAWPNE